MTPGQERHFWGAVSALREAETLAQLGNVSGPADEPPRPGDEQGWIADWSKRATETLAKAKTWVDSKKKSLRDRARRIAGHVQEGARRIYQASPIARAKNATAKALQDVTETARTLQFATLVSGGAATVLLLVGAYLVWKKFG